MVFKVFSKTINKKFHKTPTTFYGKLPAHGDFISRGLDQKSAKSVDIWLSEVIQRGQNQWGESFVTQFKSAQPWLFDGETLAAIMMPSMDKVGRLFPLLVTTQSGIAIQALYDRVYSAISESWLCDKLSAELLALNGSRHERGHKGWFLPDENIEALPHPLKGKSEVLKVFMK